MQENFWIGTLEFARFIISMIIMIYSFYFFKNRQNLNQRKVWVSMYFASMFLFIAETVNALILFRAAEFDNALFMSIQNFAGFSFICCLLFWFIQNHELLKWTSD